MPSSHTADQDRLQIKLKKLAEEISTDLSALETDQGRELLGCFVSDLYFAVAEQARRKERRQRQAKGIAAAKARGVRFGRTATPLPDNFDEVHQAWRDGEMSLQEAANACGVSRGTFYGMATRKEQPENAS